MLLPAVQMAPLDRDGQVNPNLLSVPAGSSVPAYFNKNNDTKNNNRCNLPDTNAGSDTMLTALPLS